MRNPPQSMTVERSRLQIGKTVQAKYTMPKNTTGLLLTDHLLKNHLAASPLPKNQRQKH